MEWTFQTISDGKVRISNKHADNREVLLGWVRDGLTSATDIAAEMGVSKGTISKMARKLADEGRLKITGREYSLP